MCISQKLIFTSYAHYTVVERSGHILNFGVYEYIKIQLGIKPMILYTLGTSHAVYGWQLNP